MASPVEERNMSELNVQELMAEEKKRKSALTLHAFLIGIAVGIAVYSTVSSSSAGSTARSASGCC